MSFFHMQVFQNDCFSRLSESAKSYVQGLILGAGFVGPRTIPGYSEKEGGFFFPDRNFMVAILPTGKYDYKLISPIFRVMFFCVQPDGGLFHFYTAPRDFGQNKVFGFDVDRLAKLFLRGGKYTTGRNFFLAFANRNFASPAAYLKHNITSVGVADAIQAARSPRVAEVEHKIINRALRRQKNQQETAVNFLKQKTARRI